MRILARVLLALIVLGAGTVEPAVPQNSQSTLILFVASEPTEPKVLLFKDANGKILDEFKWIKGLPAYREFILPAKDYRILIPGPIKSIEVGTSSDAQTFVQYAFTTANGAQGVQITSWRGKPSATITKAVSELRDAKADLEPVKLDLGSNGTKFFSALTHHGPIRSIRRRRRAEKIRTKND